MSWSHTWLGRIVALIVLWIAALAPLLLVPAPSVPSFPVEPAARPHGQAAGGAAGRLSGESDSGWRDDD